MVCPDCHSEIDLVSCKGVLIHECRACKGKWLRREELERVRNAADGGLRWLEFDPFADNAPHLSVVSDGKPCPHCRRPMDALRYQSSKVVINKCRACKGIWLDSGELVKIIGYLEDVVNSKKTIALAGATFKQFIEVIAGPKTVVEEVRDLWAVLYILEVRIGVEHPHLVGMVRRLYVLAPYI